MYVQDGLRSTQVEPRNTRCELENTMPKRPHRNGQVAKTRAECYPSRKVRRAVRDFRRRFICTYDTYKREILNAELSGRSSLIALVKFRISLAIPMVSELFPFSLTLEMRDSTRVMAALVILHPSLWLTARRG